MACQKGALGESLLPEFNITGDCTSDPKSDATTPLVYLPLGGLQTLTESVSYNDATAQTADSIYDHLATAGIGYEFSMTVMNFADESLLSNQQALKDFALNTRLNRAGEARGWLKLIDKHLDNRKYYYVDIKWNEQSAEAKGFRTYSFTFTVVDTYSSTNPPVQTEPGTGL